MERTFKFEKETKNTIRFQEIDSADGTMIGPVYIQKEALSKIEGYSEGKDLVINVQVKE